jgi:hypothetical protein
MVIRTDMLQSSTIVAGLLVAFVFTVDLIKKMIEFVNG